MIDLPIIPNDRTKKVEYKGQLVSIAQLAKITGFTKDSVRKRLWKGDSASDILNAQKIKVQLTKEQTQRKLDKNLTLSIIQERLDKGWDIDLAVNLSRQYVGSVDNIVFKSKVNDVDIEIPYKQLLELEKTGITTTVIGLRVSKGMTLEEAMTKPLVKNIDPHEKELLTVDYEKIDRINSAKMNAAAERYKEERLRKSKPHLETVPQKHKLSDYGRYLMSKPGIPRVKTDLYGNTQFI